MTLTQACTFVMKQGGGIALVIDNQVRTTPVSFTKINQSAITLFPFGDCMEIGHYRKYQVIYPPWDGDNVTLVDETVMDTQIDGYEGEVMTATPSGLCTPPVLLTAMHQCAVRLGWKPSVPTKKLELKLYTLLKTGITVFQPNIEHNEFVDYDPITKKSKFCSETLHALSWYMPKCYPLIKFDTKI